MTDYVDGDFANPSAVCNIVMKGGIASGVVYPLALAELAKRFRFAHVGGTSVGAIAAAAAVAAEYGRNVPGKGFMRLASLPEEIGQRLFSLFQPSPATKPIFDVFVAAMGTGGWRTMRVFGAAVSGFRLPAVLGCTPGLLILLAASWHWNGAYALLSFVLAVIGLIAGVFCGLYYAINRDIPDNDFGLCSGKSQRGYSNPGLTDWLADLIDDIAGRDPAKDLPLTFGDLAVAADVGADDHKITLQMMTTNLTLRRPYSLPFTKPNGKIYAFRLADFEKLFPERITRYLAEYCERIDALGQYDDLFRFPEPGSLPLIVAVRMSLSFPLLFCAVPLYAQDFTFQSQAERTRWRKNLFSDGGLSSNFPVHFFDKLLPASPTFGISLDGYDERRQPPDRRSRVWLPNLSSAASSIGFLAPGPPVGGIFSFLMQAIDAAKDWQDNLQSALIGYRERIVHVTLKSDEGGLNIAMPPGLVLELGAYGELAGGALRDEFDLDEHRWRRFLMVMGLLDKILGEIAEAYGGENGLEPLEQFLVRYPDQARTYKEAAASDIVTLRKRATALAELAKYWSQLQIPDHHMPHSNAVLRITPRS